MMVVGRRAELRWRLTGALGLAPSAASAPEVAASRLAHPSTNTPEAVVLVVDDVHDLGWLHAHARRGGRSWVPVVAVVTRPRLADAARGAGARAVVELAGATNDLGQQLRAAVAEVTAPAVVIDLDAVRTA